MTYGIPNTSYGPSSSPSLDNATWFNHSGFERYARKPVSTELRKRAEAAEQARWSEFMASLPDDYDILGRIFDQRQVFHEAGWRSKLFRLIARNAPNCTLFRFDWKRSAYVFRPWPKFEIGADLVKEAGEAFR